MSMSRKSQKELFEAIESNGSYAKAAHESWAKAVNAIYGDAPLSSSDARDLAKSQMRARKRWVRV